MKKKAILGLVALGLVSVSSAATLDFAPGGGDYNWSTAGNWNTGGTDTSIGTTPAGAAPTAGDDVRVDNTTDYTTGLVIQANNATAATLHIGATTDYKSSAHVTINSGAQLTLTGALTFGGNHKRSGYLTNRGTLNVEGGNTNKNGSGYFDNYGTMNFYANRLTMNGSRNWIFNQYAGSITCGSVLLVAAGDESYDATFNMMGGDVTGTRLLSTDEVGGAVLNLSGGTMTFTGFEFLDRTNNTMNVTGGRLTIAGRDMKAYFENAITAGQLTGVRADQVIFDGTDTFIAVPEPAIYALFAGCFGLAWVMLRRRRS